MVDYDPVTGKWYRVGYFSGRVELTQDEVDDMMVIDGKTLGDRILEGLFTKAISRMSTPQESETESIVLIGGHGDGVIANAQKSSRWYLIPQQGPCGLVSIPYRRTDAKHDGHVVFLIESSTTVDVEGGIEGWRHTIKRSTFDKMKLDVEYLLGTNPEYVVKKHVDKLIARKLETFAKLSDLVE